MCLATPVKIKEIRGKKAIVEHDGHSHEYPEVDLSLIKNPQIGEYILVHGEMAINKVPESDAKKILEYVESVNH